MRRSVVIPRACNVVRTSIESGTNSRADVQRIASLAATEGAEEEEEEEEENEFIGSAAVSPLP